MGTQTRMTCVIWIHLLRVICITASQPGSAPGDPRIDLWTALRIPLAFEAVWKSCVTLQVQEVTVTIVSSQVSAHPNMAQRAGKANEKSPDKKQVFFSCS